MAAPNERPDDIQMDVSSLCREEIYTDRRFGTIRVLVPVDANGSDDPKRPTVYTGEAQIMTQVGALPISFETVSLFVNAALVNPEDAPATTEAMLAQAQEAPTLGVGLYNTLYHLYWGIPAYGGALFDAAGRAVLADQGDVAGYLAWLQQISATPGSYVDPDYGMLKDRFKKGEFAYFVDGPWAIAELTEALGDTLNVAALPAGPGGPAGSWLHADGVFLNPNVAPEQVALALAFARHVTSAASGTLLASVGRKLPANQAANLGANALLQGFMRQAATAQPMPTIPEMNVAWAYAGDMFVTARATTLLLQ